MTNASFITILYVDYSSRRISHNWQCQSLHLNLLGCFITSIWLHVWCSILDKSQVILFFYLSMVIPSWLKDQSCIRFLSCNFSFTNSSSQSGMIVSSETIFELMKLDNPSTSFFLAFHFFTAYNSLIFLLMISYLFTSDPSTFLLNL